jgi:hypothetical protein
MAWRVAGASCRFAVFPIEQITTSAHRGTVTNPRGLHDDCGPLLDRALHGVLVMSSRFVSIEEGKQAVRGTQDAMLQSGGNSGYTYKVRFVYVLSLQEFRTVYQSAPF